MQNRQKYYAVGQPFFSGRITRWGGNHGNDPIDEIEWGITKKELCAALTDTKALPLFDTLEAATHYSRRQKGLFANGVENKYKQYPIAEVFIRHAEVPLIKNKGYNYFEPSKLIYLGVHIHGQHSPEYYQADFSPASYHTLIAGENETLAGIKELFVDYGTQRFLRMHWNRHHAPLAADIASHLPDHTEAAFNYLQEKLTALLAHPTTNKQGSMVRRLNHALSVLGRELDVSNDHHHPRQRSRL